MTVWRGTVIIREAILNLEADGWRTLVGLAAVTALIAGVGIGELTAAASALNSLEQLRRAGRNVYIVEATTDPGSQASAVIDGERCLALNQLEHVVAAAGSRDQGATSFVKAPGTPVELIGSVGPLTRLLDPDAPATPPSEFVVAQETATKLGLTPGLPAAFKSGQPFNISLFDPSLRLPEAGSWIVAATAPGPVDACWVEFEPSAVRAGSDALKAWFATNDTTTVVRPALISTEITRDPIAEYSTRPTRLAWLYAGAGTGLLFGVNAWFKRSDIALYKTLGASPWQTASLFTIQGMLLISAAWAFATPALLLAHRSQIIDFPSAGSVSLRATALAALAGAAAQSGFHVLAALGGTSDQIRQRI